MTRKRRPRKPKMAFWTVNGIAEHLDVSTRTVHRWIADGDLIAHKFGRSTRVSDADLAGFIRICRDGE